MVVGVRLHARAMVRGGAGDVVAREITTLGKAPAGGERAFKLIRMRTVGTDLCLSGTRRLRSSVATVRVRCSDAQVSLVGRRDRGGVRGAHQAADDAVGRDG